MNDERLQRLKILWVSGAIIADGFPADILFGDIEDRIKKSPARLIPGAKIIEVSWDFARYAMAIIMVSPEWPIVPDGSVLEPIPFDSSNWDRFVVETNGAAGSFMTRPRML